MQQGAFRQPPKNDLPPHPLSHDHNEHGYLPMMLHGIQRHLQVS